MIRFLSTLQAVGVRTRDMAVPTAFAVASSVCEAAFMCLLIPLVNLLLDRGGWESPTLGGGALFAVPVPQFAIAAGYEGVLAYVLLMTLMCLVARVGLEYVANVELTRQMQVVIGRLRIRLLEAYLSFGKAFSDQVGVSRISAMLLHATSEVAASIVSARQFLSQVVLGLGYVLILAAISWKLFLVSLSIYPVYRLINKFIGSRIRDAAKEQRSAALEYGDCINNTTESLPMIIGYDAMKSELGSFERTTNRLVELGIVVEQRMMQLSAIQELLMPVISVLLMGLLSVASFMRAEGGGVRSIVFFLTLRRVASTANAVMMHLNKIRSVESIVSDMTNVLSNSARYCVPSGTLPMPALQKAIEFRKVNFVYHGGTSALKNVSFNIEKGRTVAIVGRTGSGKSTIISLLQRLYDVEPGCILIDGIDIREFDLASLRGRLGIVSQDIYVRNDTLRANLCFGARLPRADSELIETIRRVRLDAFFNRLENGLETALGSRGVGLSGGERQRLAIARALLRDPEILILDEATSALDRETEEQVRQLLEEMMVGRTTIVIAHRLEVLARSHHIVVIENGCVVEQGSFDELMVADGYFAQSMRMRTAASLIRAS